VLQSQPELAIDRIKQMSAAKSERDRVAARHADLLKTKTPQARDLASALKFFDTNFHNFETSTNSFADSAPLQIDQELNETLKMGDDAVKNKKYLYFSENGGVKQKLRWAQTKLDILTAARPDSKATKVAREKVADVREGIKNMEPLVLDGVIE